MEKYLNGLKACVGIFEQTAVPGCHARTKLADITQLLYVAACHHAGRETNEAINPVFGVRQRRYNDGGSVTILAQGIGRHDDRTSSTIVEWQEAKRRRREDEGPRQSSSSNASTARSSTGPDTRYTLEQQSLVSFPEIGDLDHWNVHGTWDEFLNTTAEEFNDTLF